MKRQGPSSHFEFCLVRKTDASMDENSDVPIVMVGRWTWCCWGAVVGFTTAVAAPMPDSPWRRYVDQFFFSLRFLKRSYVFIFREGKRERNINVWLPLEHPLPGTWPITQACALTGNWTSNPLVLRPVLNPLSHASQGCRLILDGHLEVCEADWGWKDISGDGNARTKTWRLEVRVQSMCKKEQCLGWSTGGGTVDAKSLY